MNKDALTKINKKFANERQCKNSRCGGYFLSETEEYCPGCREKGIDKIEVERKQENVLYTEVNVGELAKRVAELDDRLTKLERKPEKVEKVEKPKQFKSKKCENCGKKFKPVSGNQQICQPCRDILIS